MEHCCQLCKWLQLIAHQAHTVIQQVFTGPLPCAPCNSKSLEEQGWSMVSKRDKEQALTELLICWGDKYYNTHQCV